MEQPPYGAQTLAGAMAPPVVQEPAVEPDSRILAGPGHELAGAIAPTMQIATRSAVRYGAVLLGMWGVSRITKNPVPLKAMLWLGLGALAASVATDMAFLMMDTVPALPEEATE